MESENPYINQLENSSNDEIFEIIVDLSETDNPSRYVAAISIALKRELISEYQAENLLDGNTTVLDYNPNEINHQVEDFIKEKKIQKEEIKKSKISNTHFGLMLIGCGTLLFLFVYSGELYFPMKATIVAYLSVSVGLFLLVIGLFEKNKSKKKNTTSNYS